MESPLCVCARTPSRNRGYSGQRRSANDAYARASCARWNGMLSSRGSMRRAMSATRTPSASRRWRFIVRRWSKSNDELPTTNNDLRRAPARQNGRNRPQQNLQIQRRRPVVDVLQVELHPVIEIDLVPAADLPETSQARLHGEAAAVPAAVRLHLFRDRRARPDQAHVALEHIPELRQLVEREA